MKTIGVKQKTSIAQFADFLTSKLTANPDLKERKPDSDAGDDFSLSIPDLTPRLLKPGEVVSGITQLAQELNRPVTEITKVVDRHLRFDLQANIPDLDTGTNPETLEGKINNYAQQSGRSLNEVYELVNRKLVEYETKQRKLDSNISTIWHIAFIGFDGDGFEKLRALREDRIDVPYLILATLEYAERAGKTLEQVAGEFGGMNAFCVRLLEAFGPKMSDELDPLANMLGDLAIAAAESKTGDWIET